MKQSVKRTCEYNTAGNGNSLQRLRIWNKDSFVVVYVHFRSLSIGFSVPALIFILAFSYQTPFEPKFQA